MPWTVGTPRKSDFDLFFSLADPRNPLTVSALMARLPTSQVSAVTAEDPTRHLSQLYDNKKAIVL